MSLLRDDYISHDDLSDTEDMDEDEDSDNQSDIGFRLRYRKRRRLQQIQDTEEIVQSESSCSSFDNVSTEGDTQEIASGYESSHNSSQISTQRFAPRDSPDLYGGEGAGSTSSDTEVDFDISPPSPEGAPALRSRIFLPEYVEDDPDTEVSSMRTSGSSFDGEVVSDIEEVSRVFVGENSEGGEFSPISMNHGDVHSNPSSPSYTSDEGDADQQDDNTVEVDNAELNVVGPEDPPKEQTAGTSNVAAASASFCSNKDDEGQTCPICFEMWTNAGDHRIVALKCGHLFGKKCIERWLKGHGSKCPQCNSKVAKKDLIFIYASNIKVEDTLEKERLMQEIDKLKQAKADEEKAKAQLLMRMSVDSQLLKQLQKDVQLLKNAKAGSVSQSSNSGGSGAVSKNMRLSPFQSFELSKDGTCRVMAFNKWMNLMIVSIPSVLSMFPGFGIKKLNTLSLKVEKYVHLHSKQIRDLDFNPCKRDLLLSVSLDKSAKVTNMSSNATVVSYKTEYPLWCCCWNSDKSTEFFTGTSLGLIYHFDTVQNTQEPIYSYKISGSGPIVSLTYVPLDNNKEFYNCGLIVTRLTSVSFLEILDGEVKDHGLPLEGPFSHTAFDPVSRLFLTTCRPTDKKFHSRHILYELKVMNVSEVPTTVTNVITANQIHCYEGSTTMKVLSRNCLSSYQNDENNCTVVISEESTSSIKIFDVSTSSLIQTIKLNLNIVDILSVENSHGKYMAFLSDKTVKLYKWIES